MSGTRVGGWRLSVPVADALLALAFVGVAGWERFLADLQFKAGPLAVDLPMTGAVLGLLALRRAAPFRVLVLTCAVVTVPTFFVRHDFLVWSHLLPLLVEVYTVARHRPLGFGVAAGLLGAATAAVNLYFDVGDRDPAGLIGPPMILALPVAIGVVMRRNAERRSSIAAALVRLDSEREVRARTVVLAERVRVARDLHDVVAHAVSVMTVQARVAAELADRDPLGAQRSILALETAGRAATAELRRMLGLLRVSTNGADEPGEPAPDLNAVEALLDRMRQAGLRVDLVIEGERPVLPPGFAVTAYRIVQEALTNVLIHAGPVQAQLTLRFGPEIAIEVVDGGPETGVSRLVPETGGQGLVGMRERVALLGGRLSAGPDGQGFRVRVRLPRPDPA